MTGSIWSIPVGQRSLEISAIPHRDSPGHVCVGIAYRMSMYCPRRSVGVVMNAGVFLH